VIASARRPRQSRLVAHEHGCDERGRHDHILSGLQRMSPVGEAEADTDLRRAGRKFLMRGVEDMR
jgi:hypothetical protein